MKDLINTIKKLNNYPIYLAGHINPDQDSICSCLALAIFLKLLGKEAYVLLQDKEKGILDWNPNFDIIRNSINHSKYNFISLDLNENKRLGDFEKYFHDAQYTINIDHHQDNKFEADFTFFDTKASSTCEIIFKLINEYDSTLLNFEICNYLYSGILNDTNCFSRRLSENTLFIAQQLINNGIDYIKILNKTYAQRSLYEYKALAKAINDIEYDNFHFLIIDKACDEYKNLSYNQILKKIAEDLRKIIGIEILILLIKEDNKITGKCMTNTLENAHLIAQIFGGGGHLKEAGFTIYDTSIEDVLSKIKNYVNENESIW